MKIRLHHSQTYAPLEVDPDDILRVIPCGPFTRVDIFRGPHRFPASETPEEIDRLLREARSLSPDHDSTASD